ncbi:NlpC/P60 family protein [Parasedimentitalea huanghaiensis]|uniref:Peptidase n=1 Tax=Parasedimentitalea huanghaiensis TaxID=2682100 RepID=A0A6L6WFF2_9RHOB|nr:NlpC/P60 family protein [Zongyanglinia huanghaiensis]MVO14737.1 peptidase [Zongyanglinia huanghaiensis]
MTVLADQVVQVARTWIGTPYLHQAASKGAGCDCLGLVRGIWREVLGEGPAQVPAYSKDWSEPQGEERLWQAAMQYLVGKPLDQAAVGDVILFRMRHGAVAKHLGIQSRTEQPWRFVHAYSGHGVVESPLSIPWRRRIVARFHFPEEKI